MNNDIVNTYLVDETEEQKVVNFQTFVRDRKDMLLGKAMIFKRFLYSLQLISFIFVSDVDERHYVCCKWVQDISCVMGVVQNVNNIVVLLVVVYVLWLNQTMLFLYFDSRMCILTKE